MLSRTRVHRAHDCHYYIVPSIIATCLIFYPYFDTFPITFSAIWSLSRVIIGGLKMQPTEVLQPGECAMPHKR